MSPYGMSPPECHRMGLWDVTLWVITLWDVTLWDVTL